MNDILFYSIVYIVLITAIAFLLGSVVNLASNMTPVYKPPKRKADVAPAVQQPVELPVSTIPFYEKEHPMKAIMNLIFYPFVFIISILTMLYKEFAPDDGLSIKDAVAHAREMKDVVADIKSDIDEVSEPAKKEEQS